MIIAVDFDGTITTKNEYPKIGTYNLEVMMRLNRLKSAGHELILWTCRTGQDLQEAVHGCEVRGLTFDAINENVPRIQEIGWGSGRKIYADLYFDDKSTNSILELVRLIEEGGQ